MKQNMFGLARIGSAVLCASLLALGSQSSLAARAAAEMSTIGAPAITSLRAASDETTDLLASGTVAALIKGKVYNVAFTNVPVVIMLAADQSGAEPAAPNLRLELGQIDVEFLGLRIVAAPVALTLSGWSNGGPLGELLRSLAAALKAGEDGVLWNRTQIILYQSGLANLLNDAAPRLYESELKWYAPLAAAADDAIIIFPRPEPRARAALYFELAPVALNLRGLNVAHEGAAIGVVALRGGLLGNELSSEVKAGDVALGSTLRAVLRQILEAPRF